MIASRCSGDHSCSYDTVKLKDDFDTVKDDFGSGNEYTVVRFDARWESSTNADGSPHDVLAELLAARFEDFQFTTVVDSSDSSWRDSLSPPAHPCV